jgi:tripartite-type tricarboxylate transporter receptor subunit TctC
MTRKTMWATALVLIVGLGLLLVGSALAADYPSRAIRIIYPWPAGSGGDIATRLLANALSKVLGQPVKVMNVAGGRGTIGAARVAREKPDGYVLGSLPIGPALTQPLFARGLPYQTSSLEAICMFTYLPLVLVVGPQAPYKNLKQFIAYARKNPGKIVFAHPGIGSVPYLAMRALEASAKIKMRGVPFKGLRPGVTAVVGGHVSVAPAALAGVVGFAKAGRLRILALFAAKRLALAPTIPAVEEFGVKTYPMVWTGMFAPKGLKPAVLKKIQAALAKVINDPKFVAAMTRANQPVLYMNQADFLKKIQDDIKYFQAFKAKKKGR